mmetsp:Transcript_95146/g.238557  ORF Transcript_95146/g.238557 Transcript_95146/m.238557 type:complete len:100 (-) Transcript_95146:143-442(-)
MLTQEQASCNPQQGLVNSDNEGTEPRCNSKGIRRRLGSLVAARNAAWVLSDSRQGHDRTPVLDTPGKGQPVPNLPANPNPPVDQRPDSQPLMRHADRSL